jgi:hypothetical protein
MYFGRPFGKFISGVNPHPELVFARDVATPATKVPLVSFVAGVFNPFD